jgi:hypothetical protein
MQFLSKTTGDKRYAKTLSIYYRKNLTADVIFQGTFPWEQDKKLKSGETTNVFQKNL